MEKNEFGPFPPEVWSHILSYLDDFKDLIDLKIVNKLFDQELSTRIPLDREIKLSKDNLRYFQNKDTTYSLPREHLIQAVQQKSINGIQNGMLIFNVIAVGDLGVGITTLLYRYAKGQYNREWEELTICPTYLTKKFEDPGDGVTTKIYFWDTAGSERFRALVRGYYRGARGVFMCFSIDDKQSFITLVNKFVPDMCKEFRQYAPEQQPVIYLIGLKSDLEDQRQVSVKEAKVLARVLKVKYFECSAKTNTNIDEMMQSMKEDLHRDVRVPGLSVPPPAPTNANQESKRWCSIQ